VPRLIACVNKKRQSKVEWSVWFIITRQFLGSVGILVSIVTWYHYSSIACCHQPDVEWRCYDRNTRNDNLNLAESDSPSDRQPKTQRTKEWNMEKYWSLKRGLHRKEKLKQTNILSFGLKFWKRGEDNGSIRYELFKLTSLTCSPIRGK
jgi:hypothetical protein